MKKRIAVSTAVLALTASLAFGAWLLVGLISGEGSSKAGKAVAAAVTAVVTFSPENGLVPPGTPTEGGNNTGESLMAEVPASSIKYKILTAVYEVTTSNEGACPKANFMLEPAAEWSGAAKVATATFTKTGNPWESKTTEGSKEHTANVSMVPTAPTGCEGVTWKVHVELTHS
jgi:hypothetical protein